MITRDEEMVELFADDFTSYPLTDKMDQGLPGGPGVSGDLPAGEMVGKRDPLQSIGPWLQTSLHYSWRSPRTGVWTDCRLPWQIIERDGRRFLNQPESWFNVVLRVFGGEDWCDYVLDLDLWVADGPAGPVVRYHTSRRNYWLAFEAGKPLALIRRDQDKHVTLARAPNLVVQRDRIYQCRVLCEGPNIAVAVDGQEVS